MAGDERGGGGGEEDDSAGNFDGLADAVEGGDALDDVGAKGGVGEGFAGALRGDECGSDGIYGDVVRAPLDGETFCEVRNRGFAGAVDGFGGQGGESGLRTHIDDASALLAHHEFCSGLTGEESGLQV